MTREKKKLNAFPDDGDSIHFSSSSVELYTTTNALAENQQQTFYVVICLFFISIYELWKCCKRKYSWSDICLLLVLHINLCTISESLGNCIHGKMEIDSFHHCQ